MRNTIFLIIISLLTSCLNIDDINQDKYNDLIISPDVLLPFVQLDLSEDFYDSIYKYPTKDSIEIETAVDVFENDDITKIVDTIEFNFHTINGYPIVFDKMSIIFLDVNNILLEELILTNISSATLKSDGSLDTPNKQDFKGLFTDVEIDRISKTRNIKVNLSWKNNTQPYPNPDPSFYFKMYSDILLKTKELGK